MVKSLDLHGIKHENVSRIIDSFLGHHIKRKTIEVSIITGNSEPMKSIVHSVLKDYRLTSEQSIINPGKIIVKLI